METGREVKHPTETRGEDRSPECFLGPYPSLLLQMFCKLWIIAQAAGRAAPWEVKGKRVPCERPDGAQVWRALSSVSLTAARGKGSGNSRAASLQQGSTEIPASSSCRPCPANAYARVVPKHHCWAPGAVTNLFPIYWDVGKMTLQGPVGLFGAGVCPTHSIHCLFPAVRTGGCSPEMCPTWKGRC